MAASQCTSEEYYALMEHIHTTREELLDYLEEAPLDTRFSVYPELVRLSQMQERLENLEVIPV